MTESKPSRRHFLGGVGAAAMAAGTPASTTTTGRRRLGLIGAGARGREHLRALREGGFPCDIVAVCDIVPAHAEEAVKVSGGSPVIYDDYRKFLEHEGLDTVVVAVPNFLHKQVVLAVLKRGLDLLCEKPMALTIEECDEMIRAWRDGNSVFMLGLQNRWHPCHQKVRQLIADGVIGKVRHIAAAEFRGDWKKIDPGSSNISHVNWRYFDLLSGGSLLEKHTHDFDLFEDWLGAQALRVCGFGGTGYYPDRDSLDHASVVLEFESACTVSLDFDIGNRYGQGFHDWMVVGDKGHLAFKRKGDRVQVTTWDPRKHEEVIPTSLNSRDTRHGGTLGLHTEFFDCLQTRRIPVTNPLVGRRSVKVAQGAQQAIRTHQVVELGELGL